MVPMKERYSTFVYWLIKVFNLSVTHAQSPDEDSPGIYKLYNDASTATGAGRGLLAKK